MNTPIINDMRTNYFDKGEWETACKKEFNGLSVVANSTGNHRWIVVDRIDRAFYSIVGDYGWIIHSTPKEAE